MKKTLFILIAALFTLSLTEKPAIPKLEFEYAGVFDQICAGKSGNTMDPKFVEMARSSTPRFQNYWDESAPNLMTTLFDMTGQEFYRKELTVYTTICDYVPMSQPFLLNVQFWIQEDNDRNRRSVVQMTFHEFLHKYLVSVADWNKIKLVHGEFKNEDASVKAHLHLMALEMLIYKSAGRQDLYDTADFVYKNLIKGSYKKSWELVLEHGPEKFLEDLNQALK